MYCYLSPLPPRFGILEITRLLLSLDVVATFQAPSSESKPDSPLPVTTTFTVVLYTTINS